MKAALLYKNENKLRI